MSIKKKLLFRNRGKVYILVSSAAPLRPNPENIFPIRILQIQEKNWGSLWLIEIPYSDTLSKYKIKLISNKDTDEELTVDYRYATWESRLNWRLHFKKCEALKKLSDFPLHDTIQLEIIRYLDKDEFAIWRIQARYKNFDSDKLFFRCIDGAGNPIDFKLYDLEEQSIEEPGDITTYVLYSLQIPKETRNFSFEVRSLSDESVLGFSAPAGFCAVDFKYHEGLLDTNRNWTKDASSNAIEYVKWLEQHTPNKEDLAEQASNIPEDSPKFSIVIKAIEARTAWLKECVSSIQNQSYQKWELVLVCSETNTNAMTDNYLSEFYDDRIKVVQLPKRANLSEGLLLSISHTKGDWLIFLNHEDSLAPDALYQYAKYIKNNADVSALYCDEDSLSETHSFEHPLFKDEALNVDLLYTHDYISHFFAVERSALKSVGLSSAEFAEVQIYDLALRLLADKYRFGHVAHVLCHHRANSQISRNEKKSADIEKAQKLALENHFKQRAIEGTVETTDLPFFYRVRYTLSDPLPLVSIIIPNKDHVEVLDACVRSIIDKATYQNFEIIIVENNSTNEQTFAYYERLKKTSEKVRIITWKHEFNFSSIINFGVEHAQGDRLLLLNNDTEVISPDFIEEMLGYLERPEVGVVGAKLYFKDELVQHAGIEVGPFDAIVHVNQDFTHERKGYRNRAVLPGNFSAVTGACQMVRREVFDEISGYDERFAVGFNDADFCMRAYKAGYLTVFTPYAELYHYEFTSRGREEVNDEKLKRWTRENELFHEIWAEYFEKGDPFSNPNLSLESCYYALGNS